ncbi:uncharacterized protein LOC128959824 [Oppia nitens]|uniref:uncharacterized protein LOC128959824 n=1 Tax=Oppia nitens TaxID=1686743 RepID=UPI0023DB034A|nr:uncharacterized protein LOC128959824 [Oppia nitens]
MVNALRREVQCLTNDLLRYQLLTKKYEKYLQFIDSIDETIDENLVKMEINSLIVTKSCSESLTTLNNTEIFNQLNDLKSIGCQTCVELRDEWTQNDDKSRNINEVNNEDIDCLISCQSMDETIERKVDENNDNNNNSINDNNEDNSHMKSNDINIVNNCYESTDNHNYYLTQTESHLPTNSDNTDENDEKHEVMDSTNSESSYSLRNSRQSVKSLANSNCNDYHNYSHRIDETVVVVFDDNNQELLDKSDDSKDYRIFQTKANDCDKHEEKIDEKLNQIKRQKSITARTGDTNRRCGSCPRLEHRKSLKKVKTTLADKVLDKVCNDRTTMIIGKYQCQHCSAMFADSIALKLHELRHNTTYQCTEQGCMYSTGNEHDFHAHTKNAHHRQYRCRFDGCDKAYGKMAYLRTHELCVHPDELPDVAWIDCSYDGCQYRCKYNHYMRAHISQHELPFQCTIDGCTKSFRSPTVLRKHQQSVHNLNTGDLPWLQCPHCPYRNKLENLLKRHMFVHTKPFNCDDCDQCFSNSLLLSAHMTKHTGMKKNYRCEWPDCGKRFAKTESLNNHMETHSRRHIEYRCEWSDCERTYTTKNSLQMHVERQHKGKGVYRCHWPGCDYQTTNSIRYRYHQQKHDGSVPVYECQAIDCNYKTKMKDEFDIHIDTKHDSLCDLSRYQLYSMVNALRREVQFKNEINSLIVTKSCSVSLKTLNNTDICCQLNDLKSIDCQTSVESRDEWTQTDDKSRNINEITNEEIEEDIDYRISCQLFERRVDKNNVNNNCNEDNNHMKSININVVDNCDECTDNHKSVGCQTCVELQLNQWTQTNHQKSMNIELNNKDIEDTTDCQISCESIERRVNENNVNNLYENHDLNHKAMDQTNSFSDDSHSIDDTVFDDYIEELNESDSDDSEDTIIVDIEAIDTTVDGDGEDDDSIMRQKYWTIQKLLVMIVIIMKKIKLKSSYYSRPRLQQNKSTKRIKTKICDEEDKEYITDCKDWGKLNGKYRCKQCSATFIQLKYLKLHQLRHETTYQCTEQGCEYSTGNQQDFLDHSNNVHNRQHSCRFDGCDKTYGKLSYLRTHELCVHPDEFPDVPWIDCSYDGCQYRCKYKHYMRAHISQHELPFQCSIDGCSKRFMSDKVLDRHQQRMHDMNTEDLPWLQCPHCPYRNKLKNRFDHHMLRHTKPYKCDNCEQSFSSPFYLSAHMSKHTGIKKYQCDWPDCGKSFAKKASLNLHMATHKRDKEYRCEWPGCDRIYTIKSSLEMHVDRQHKGKGVYRCHWPGCDYQTTNSIRFKYHMQKHDGSVPVYECQSIDCNYKTKMKDAFDIHMNTKHR